VSLEEQAVVSILRLTRCYRVSVLTGLALPICLLPPEMSSHKNIVKKQEVVGLFHREIIVDQHRFDDPNLPGEMMTTITLKKVMVGTELNIVQEGVPAVIPAEACYLGWQESLTLLAQLVQAEIPEQP